MVKNLERLNELNDKVKNKMLPYEKIKSTLDMKGVESINCVSLKDKDVEEYMLRELQVLVNKRLQDYKNLSTRLTLNDEDLDHVEDYIDRI